MADKNDAREWLNKNRHLFVRDDANYKESYIDDAAMLTAYAAALTQEREALRLLSPTIVEMLEHYRRDAEIDAPGRYRSGTVQECIDALQSFAAEESQPK